MNVPKPPNFDAAAWTARLKEAIPKRLDGIPIAVWDQLPDFVKWLRGQRDILNAHELQLNGKDGIKQDLDSHTDRLNTQNERLVALEARPVIRPFP